MAQTKKRSASKAQSKAKQAAISRQKRHVLSVILFAVAILMLAIAVIKGERVWTAMHGFIRGMFGWGAFIIPFALGYIAFMLATDKENSKVTSHTFIASGIVLTLASIVDIFSHTNPDDPFFSLSYWGRLVDTYKHTADGGFGFGLTGAIIPQALNEAFGHTGAWITVVVLSFIFVMLLTGTTLISLAKAVEAPAKKIKEVAEDAYERRAEREAEKEAEREEARKAGLVDISGGDDRSKYDVAVDGEDSDEKRRHSLRKKGKKVLDTYHDTGKIDIEVSDDDGAQDESQSPFDIPINDGEGVGNDAPIEAEPAISPELLDALAGDIKVIKDSSENTDMAEIEENGEIEATVDEEIIEDEYKLPPIDLLKKPADENASDIRNELKLNAEKLVDTLHSFGVDARVINISRGPSVTRYELQPAAGVRISKIANLTDDIALSLAASGVRIEAPIPNKPAVGIEVPNKAKSSVAIRSLIDCDAFNSAKSRITGVLGKDITGENCYMDIAKMPHVLIAGTTGSGKSVCLNSLIISILYRANPDEVKLVMIDPKAVEMKVYNGIPHLLVPVVTDPRKASGTLGWAVTEMLRRYQLLSEYDVRNIDGYNELADKDDSMEHLPQIVILIDELADLMMAAPNEVEDSICRLAQMARAAGMHLVIATQSPRADVITGLIKANIPSRIALKVASNIESRIILDMQGAERLIGYGDMLYSPVGTSKPIRIQGCWISDEEIKAVTDFIKGKGTRANYSESVMQEIERQASLANAKKKGAASLDDSDGDSGDEDEMLPKAIECVIDAGQASASMLQRKLKLGYARAGRIIDQLEARNIIGPYEGSKPRAVLMTRQQWLEMQATQSDSE